MEIKPFKAYRFNKEAVGQPGDCIAPPYDVISPDRRERLYGKSKYNIVRLISGREKASDTVQDNKYTRAGQYLKAWLKTGILKQDAEEAVYAYVQDFEALGRNLQRAGFIALARLEEFGKSVKPHEEILDKPVADRLKLSRATKAKLGLVFMLYSDEKNTADKIMEKKLNEVPLIDFVDEDDTRHRLFAITSKSDVQALKMMIAEKSCIIADGHHRYTTGLIYSRENPSPEAKYEMVVFYNTCNDGLVILATHRLVNNLENFSSAKLIDGLKNKFEISEYPFEDVRSKQQAKKKIFDRMELACKNGRNAFGIYSGDGCFRTAILKDSQTGPDESLASDASRRLDVSVLHRLILDDLLGIDEKKLAAGDNLEYVKDSPSAVSDSIKKVDSGDRQAAFFMNPPSMEQIQAITDNGEKMPQKSTFFYPKTYSGLTIEKI